MSEKEPNHDSTPKPLVSHEGDLPPHQRVPLHGKALESSGTLVGHEEALRAFSVNGSILAIVELPPKEATAAPRKLGVIDFGEEAAEAKDPVVCIPTTPGKTWDVGEIQARFGLVGLNYKPADLVAAYAPIPEENGVVIGRSEEGKWNHQLGLSQARDLNPHLSQQHATISVSPEAVVQITDHSTNGTQVLLPPA